jgi:hypothetical protein
VQDAQPQLAGDDRLAVVDAHVHVRGALALCITVGTPSRRANSCVAEK